MRTALLAVLLLAGCAPQITSATSDHISIVYDVAVTAPEEVQARANQHCERFGGRAKLISRSGRAPWHPQSDSFACVAH